MSKYLDKTGLTHFWGKVKEKLNNKADNSDVTNVKNQLEEKLNYKADRNQLNGKADIDRYQVRTISTNKFKFDTPKSQNYYLGSVFLNNPEKNNFAEPLPSGYTIWCILAVQLCIFTDEEKYNNNLGIWLANGYTILPIEKYTDGSLRQEWNVNTHDSMNIYGVKYNYTLLVVKPMLPV